jgi:hypothetical protein
LRAQRSNPEKEHRKTTGLLRHFVPRNDAEIFFAFFAFKLFFSALSAPPREAKRWDSLRSSPAYGSSLHAE